MGNLNSTPVDWTTAYGGISAWNLNNEVRDALTNLQGGWVSYAPAFKNFTSGPTWTGANGIHQGSYHQVGKTVIGKVFIKLPSTFANGTGNYYVSLPPLGNAKQSAGGVPYACGSGYYYDQSTPQMFDLIARIWTTNVFVLYVTGTTGNTYNVSPTTPVAPAAGDEVAFSFCYELA